DEARQFLGKQDVHDLFPESRAPEAALGGLWLYFGCFDECHRLIQDLPSPEGSFWHGILHRQEPDAGNAAYWFRQLRTHPIFTALIEAAAEITRRYGPDGFQTSARWDPFSFIDYCEKARQEPSSRREHCAMNIQRAEWQLLFDYCAGRKQ